MNPTSFFEGVSQIEFNLHGEHYVRMPVFYQDASFVSAVFPARLGRLRDWMPDPRLSPARLAPGVGAVMIACFEYREADVGAYNELAITVVLNQPSHRLNIPGRALLEVERRHQVHSWVQHLPVTTEFARVSGVDLYNYPKLLADIEFNDDLTECRLSEGEEHIFTLKGPRLPTSRGGQLQAFNHVWMNQQPQGSEFKLNLLEIGMSRRPGAARLTIGERHPISRELDEVLLSRRSIDYRVVPRMEAILFGPEKLTLPTVATAVEHYGINTVTPQP